MVNLIGNHELYNFSRAELAERLGTAPPAAGCVLGSEGGRHKPHNKFSLFHHAQPVDLTRQTPDNSIQIGNWCHRGREYYTFLAAPGWRFLMLDPYQGEKKPPS